MGDGVSESGDSGEEDATSTDGDADADLDREGDADVDTDLDRPPEADLDADRDRDDGRLDADADPDVERDADEGPVSPCPPEMVELDSCCMDLFEAPNRRDALPLVMYNFVEAADWCAAHGKRLCFDDEWQGACEGPEGLRYPYGNDHVPGVCNDEEVWRVYTQSLLNGWPGSAASPEIESLDELFTTAAGVA